MGEEAIQKAFHAGAGFINGWWPLLVVGAVLACCLIKPLGSLAVRTFRRISELVRQFLLTPGAFILAHHTHVKDDWRVLVLRGIWFVTVFAVLMAGAVTLPPVYAFVCSMVGGWLALSVGGFWVGVESRALEEEVDNLEADQNVNLADQLQLGGITALILFLVFMTWSFQTADAAFHWFRAPDSTIHTWAFFSLHLLFQAVNLGDVIQRDISPVEPSETGGRIIFGLYFFSLTVLVINGLTLIARRENAIRNWIARLKTTGDFTGVRRFGSRIWDDLLEAAEKNHKHADAALYALAECKPPSPKRMIKNPIHDGIVKLFTMPGEEDKQRTRQVAAAAALGNWRSFMGSNALIKFLTHRSGPLEVQCQAVLSLSAYRSVPDVNRDQVVGVLCDVVRGTGPCGAGKHSQVRVAAIDALIHHFKPGLSAGSQILTAGFKPLQVPEQIKTTLHELALRSAEPDDVSARALHALEVFGLLDIGTQTLMELSDRLRTSVDWYDRREAARILAEVADRPEVTGWLIEASNKEKSVPVKVVIVRSLSRIAAIRPNDVEVIHAIRSASHDERYEVRQVALQGLEMLPFRGDVVDRLGEMASEDKSSRVRDMARKVLAKKDIVDLPPEQAEHCRNILEQAAGKTAEEPSSLDQESVAELIHVLHKHPELIEKLKHSNEEATLAVLKMLSEAEPKDDPEQTTSTRVEMGSPRLDHDRVREPAANAEDALNGPDRLV